MQRLLRRLLPVSLLLAAVPTLAAPRSFSGSAADGGKLGTLNKLTGVFTLIGQTIPDGSSLLDLAFQTPCPPIRARGSSWGRLKTIYR